MLPGCIQQHVGEMLKRGARDTSFIDELIRNDDVSVCGMNLGEEMVKWCEISSGKFPISMKNHSRIVFQKF